MNAAPFQDSFRDGFCFQFVLRVCDDLVKFLSMQREIEIRYLTDYISGKSPG